MEMSWEQILMMLTPIITILATNGGLFLWARSEASSDRRQLQEEINTNRRQLQEEIQIQSKRSDELYQMFIDLLREGKK